MQKQEFLELFEAATRAAAKSVTKSGEENSPEVSRCIKALNCLKKAPESLACLLVLNTTSFGKSFGLFITHKNPRIRSNARILKDLWLKYLYGTGRKHITKTTKEEIPVEKEIKKVSSGDSKRDKVRESPVEKEKKVSSTGDCKRDKVREILQTSLTKVFSEVLDNTEMKNRVITCDPWTVAVSVESAMFEKLGCFMGPEKAKYRSILFNMSDSQNPDLRRKVLIGEIDGEKLATMKREEMASKKIQTEIQLIKEKARLKEESRIKMLPLDMLMT